MFSSCMADISGARQVMPAAVTSTLLAGQESESADPA